MRVSANTVLVAAALLMLPSLLNAADQGAADAPRIAGELTFTCVPDAKSKAAGAKEFEDTLDLGEDRVKSKALAAEGFPGTLAIPKVVNGIPTFNIVFKKPGTTATYFIRAKPGGDVTGSFTRVEGGKTLRYTIGGGGGGSKQAGDTEAKTPSSLDPDVLRVNGGYVRLMSVQVAMADAGVRADKAKLAAILKAAGADQNALRNELAQGKLDAKQYVTKAEARLNEAQRSVTQFLGEHAAAVRAAQDKPFAATYVYLNQMRGAVVDAGGGDAKHADQLIYQSLLELTKLARAKDKLTPEAAETLREQTKAGVTKALAESHRERFDKALDAMASYKADDAAPGGASHTKPAR
jgi:hypothetical protein